MPVLFAGRDCGFLVRNFKSSPHALTFIALALIHDVLSSCCGKSVNEYSLSDIHVHVSAILVVVDTHITISILLLKKSYNFNFWKQKKVNFEGSSVPLLILFRAMLWTFGKCRDWFPTSGSNWHNAEIHGPTLCCF